MNVNFAIAERIEANNLPDEAKTILDQLDNLEIFTSKLRRDIMPGFHVNNVVSITQMVADNSMKKGK